MDLRQFPERCSTWEPRKVNSTTTILPATRRLKGLIKVHGDEWFIVARSPMCVRVVSKDLVHERWICRDDHIEPLTHLGE